MVARGARARRQETAHQQDCETPARGPPAPSASSSGASELGGLRPRPHPLVSRAWDDRDLCRQLRVHQPAHVLRDLLEESRAWGREAPHQCMSAVDRLAGLLLHFQGIILDGSGGRVTNKVSVRFVP